LSSGVFYLDQSSETQKDRLTHLPSLLLPHFSSLANKSPIGKVDEILGPINEVYFTIKMDPGMVATSFKPDDKVYISGDKLLPIERFLPKPKSSATKGSY